MEDKNESVDMKLKLDTRSDGVYLACMAAKGNGRQLGLSDIIKFVENSGVTDFDLRAISQVANSTAEKTVVKISSSLFFNPVDEKVGITISSDKMEATAVFFPPVKDGKKLTSSDIFRELDNKRVTYGIDDKYIRSLLNEKKYNVPYVVARGVHPVKGVDAELTFSIRKEKRSVHPKLMENGKVDFRELDLIEVVTAKQVLATITPPKEGSPGKNVLGTDLLPSRPKNVKMPIGKNVSLSPDGLQLISDIDGLIQFVNNKISVLPVYEVQGNVDNSTGNIQFLGSVLVKGNVTSGFLITATGDVEVKGVVEGATIQAKGDVVVEMGIQGMGKCKIQAGGNIKAKYIENSKIRAGGSITTNVIMHSQVWCGNDLNLEGRKGLFVGGFAKVGGNLNAQIIGSQMATVTEIEVGLEIEVYERYKTMTSELTTLKADITKLDQSIEALMKLKQANMLNEERKTMLIKFIRTKSLALEKIEDYQHQISELIPHLEKSNGLIKVKDTIHQGVKVTIGNAVMYVKDELRFCTLYNADSEIKVGTYS